MATNSIIPFCPTDTGTNLQSDATYLAASDRINGNQPGIASQRLVNKALRQASLMAAGLAQWAANRSGTNFADTMTVSNVETALNLAITLSTPGRLINIRVITASQTYTPTAGTTSLQALVQGAGGAGGGATVPGAGQVSAGPGGCGGGTAIAFISAAAATGQFITIGAPGAGQVAGSGTYGGTTAFGSLCSATGGAAGGLGTPSAVGSGFVAGGGGPPGVGVGGFMNFQGSFGDWATFSGTGQVNGGRGGDSYFGGGARWSDITSGGNSSAIWGAGGGGCSLGPFGGPGSGGNGGPGACVIWEYS